MFFDSWGLPENVMQCMIFLILFASWVFRLLPYLLCLYAYWLELWGVMPIHSCEISFGLHSVVRLFNSRCRDDSNLVISAAL